MPIVVCTIGFFYQPNRSVVKSRSEKLVVSAVNENIFTRFWKCFVGFDLKGTRFLKYDLSSKLSDANNELKYK
jgi:hypothetical protein